LNPLCPNCQTELTDDFGLVDCKSCGAVCSIDLDDNVTVQSDEPELDGVVVEVVTEQDVEGGAEVDSSAATLADVETDSEGDFEYEEPKDQDELKVETSTTLSDESEDVAAAPLEPFAESEPEYENYEEASTASGVITGADFLKDLEVFSSESSDDGGHTYYDLHVSGVETPETRSLFIETLTDARLEISEELIDELLGDSSHLTLNQMSFLRLAVIYKRLLPLPLEMSWSLSEVQEQASYITQPVSEADIYADDEAVEYEDIDESH